MARTIKLTNLEARLSELSYPVARDDAAAQLRDTTLELADGQTDLDEVVASSSDDEFESADDLGGEVRALLPREAVGEPYQSEGEG